MPGIDYHHFPIISRPQSDPLSIGYSIHANQFPHHVIYPSFTACLHSPQPLSVFGHGLSVLCDPLAIIDVSWSAITDTDYTYRGP